MNILGVHIGHDSSAALIQNGRILADVAEERFTHRDCYILCRFLLCRRLADMEQTQRLIRELSRRDRSLQGEAAKVEAGTVFFRAMTLERLAALLYEEKFHDSEDEAIAFIEFFDTKSK